MFRRGFLKTFVGVFAGAVFGSAYRTKQSTHNDTPIVPVAEPDKPKRGRITITYGDTVLECHDIDNFSITENIVYDRSPIARRFEIVFYKPMFVLHGPGNPLPRLEHVGKDYDGKWKPLDELSYTQKSGWWVK